MAFTIGGKSYASIQDYIKRRAGGTIAPLSDQLARYPSGGGTLAQRSTSLSRYSDSPDIADPFADIEIYDPEEAQRQRNAARNRRA